MLATVMLAPFVISKGRNQFAEITRHDAFLILVSGVCLGFHFITWIQSLYYTSVASASTLLTGSPIFIAIIGFVFLKERLTRVTTLAIVAAVGGAILIAFAEEPNAAINIVNPRLGNGLATAAAFFVSLYMILGRVLRKKLEWITYVFSIYLVAAATVAIVALVIGTPLFGFSWKLYAIFATMAIGPQILGHGSFNYALRYFTPAFLALLSLTEPIGGTVLAYWLFGEVPLPLAFLGMSIILVAIAVTVWHRSIISRADRIGNTQSSSIAE